MRHQFLKGNIPLFITYWIFGIIPWVIYGLIGMLFNKYYLQISVIPHVQIVFYLYLLFPFFYFPIIFIAIWNSSTLYAKNKLWPILAKITVILGVAFLLIGAGVIVKQFIHRNDINYRIKQEVTLINKSLPMKIDSEATIEQVTFKNNVLSYEYRLVNKEKSKINIGFFSFIMRPKLIELVCNNKGLKYYLSKGVTISYQYIDKNRDELFDIFIKINDCK